MNRSWNLLLIGVVIIFLGCSCGDTDKKAETSSQEKDITIAVIPKGTIHEFWKSVHAGAVKASEETGVKIIWKGSVKEDDREEQLQIVETFIGTNISALVLAPLDNRALVMPVREAKTRGIPTVIIDSGLDGDTHISFVATDNYYGGVIAAEYMGKILGGKGKLILLRYQEGSVSNTNRENGFINTITTKFPEIEVLSDNQYAGVTTESAYQTSENLLNRFPEVNAMFAPNEPVTFGCLRALQDRKITEQVTLVGFDASAKLVEALEKGEVKGIVLQDPVKIGYLGVKTAVDYLKGIKVSPRIDTGVTLATPENMHEPEIWRLLHPEVNQ